MWGRDPDLVARVVATRENGTYLPGIELPPSVTPDVFTGGAIDGSLCIVSAIPISRNP